MNKLGRLPAARALGVALIALLLLAACAPAATPTPAPTAKPAAPAATAAPAKPAATTAPAATAAPAKPAATTAPAKPAGTAAPTAAAKPSAAAEQERIAKLVEGAKKEGQVVWLGQALEEKGAVVALEAAFKKKYGLPDSFKLNATRKSTGEIISTVDGEIKSNKVTIDLVNISAMPWWQDKIKQGVVMAYDSPEYANYSATDKLGYNIRPYFVSDGITFLPVWNAKRLPEVDIKSYNDVFKYNLKGKLSIGAGQTGTTIPVLSMGVAKVMGEDYWSKIGDLQPRVFSSGAERMDATVSGEFPFNMSGSPADVWAARKYKNVDFLKVAYPDEGQVFLPSSTAILKDAPHPNAAMLFMDFFRSKEAAELWMDTEGYSSGRDGVKNPAPGILRTANEMKLIPIDHKTLTDADMKQWQDFFTKHVLKK